ncbi:hypothetical protein GGX14DRAFT_600008 [Mycena pura]|uniref:Uncharacterized protein n=1 Tax=Mycena pura TaxID=153505 RepID=A0AAD6Y4V4_9AGAR|nr:hypothetical protein GGX14DRAFT_600008 [Mycena pura]
MPPGDGPLWPYFHKSKDKPNGSHHRATHWRCIDAKRPQNEPTGDKNEDENENNGSVPTARVRRRGSSWLPTTRALANLFGGAIAWPFGRPARRAKVVSEEALYMELLAAEHSDEEPDAGALEGSGDDYSE